MKNIAILLILLFAITPKLFGQNIVSDTSVNVETTQVIDSLRLLEEQNKLVENLQKQQEAFEMKYAFLIGFVIFLILLFGILCLRNKRGDQRLHTIIDLLEKNKEESSTKDSSLNDETIEIILENLEAFESTRGFLMPKLSLHSFAKQLQTNTKYASKVINTHKLTTFRNYINGLRIRYSIEQLKTNLHFRKYTIGVIAQEAGFSSKEAFTKAFRKQTGTTVSNFVKELHE